MDNRIPANRVELPIQNKNRKSTDVCCTFVSAIFAITLFIIACVFYSTNNINNAYFSDGSTNTQSCGSLVAYYSDPSNLNSKSCVNQCPNGFYNRNNICWPQSSSLQAILLNNSSIKSQVNNLGFMSALLWTSLTALAFGVLLLVLVQFTPRLAPLILLILALISLVTLLVLAFITEIFSRESKWLAISVIILLLFVISIIGLIYRNALRLQGIFLDYTRRFLYECPYLYFYIPLYLLFAFGLLFLFCFQHCAFSSKHNNNQNFFDFTNPGFLGILNIIELIWGLQFLKDSFHYCISGVSVDWYWKRQISIFSSFHRLVTRNWGSVVAGSFLNAFFQIPTLIVELLTCHKRGCCSRAGDFCDGRCSCIGFLFYLVRTDVYTYMNLTGSTYCDSARECTKICHFNNQFIGNYNLLKHYRFVAHVLAITLIVIISYYYAKIRVFQMNLWNFFSIIVVSEAFICWFIDIYADGGQAISTNFLTQSYLSQSYEFMQHAIPSYRNEIQFRSNKHKQDGNC